MKNFRDLCSLFVQIFVFVFVLIDLLLEFLLKKDFFYFFVREQLTTFPDLNNYLNSRFFPDIIAVIVSIPVTIVIMSIVFLGEERFYEEYSKKSLEEALKGDLK